MEANQFYHSFQKLLFMIPIGLNYKNLIIYVIIILNFLKNYQYLMRYVSDNIIDLMNLKNLGYFLS